MLATSNEPKTLRGSLPRQTPREWKKKRGVAWRGVAWRGSREVFYLRGKWQRYGTLNHRRGVWERCFLPYGAHSSRAVLWWMVDDKNPPKAASVTRQRKSFNHHIRSSYVGPQVFADELDRLELVPAHPAPLAGPLHQPVPHLVPHALDPRLHLLRLIRLQYEILFSIPVFSRGERWDGRVHERGKAIVRPLSVAHDCCDYVVAVLGGGHTHTRGK